MKYVHIPKRRILAINPVSRGFGFVVFEEPHHLLDWGVVRCRKRAKTKTGWSFARSECLQKIGRHLSRYQPTLVIMEDCGDPSSRRCHDVRRFLDSILNFTVSKKVPVRTFSPEDVHRAFQGYHATNKEQMAHIIARYFPELMPLPKHRGIYIGEDARMSLFSAMALIFTLLHTEE